MNMSLIDIKFEINFATLIAFIIGIISGFIVFFLFYFIGCLVSIQKKRNKLNKQLKNISKDEITDLIKKYQNEFLKIKKEKKEIVFADYSSSIINLIKDIASKFYPKSKNPICELSINELIMLDQYIIKKIDALLSKKGLNLFRNLKLSTIITLVNKKNEIDNTKVVKTVKKYKLKKIFDVTLTALNFINPYMWVKKLIVNPLIGHLLKKICLICYSIIGEETYNVYSKQAFINDDDELQELLSSIEKERLELSKEGILIEKKDK